jgi:hypothetical protein
METTVRYENPVSIQNEIAAPSTLTSSETEVFRVTDQKYLHKSQLLVYTSVVNSGLTTATFNYYLGILLSGTTYTWYPVCLYTTSSGLLSQRTTILNSGSYSSSGSWYGSDFVPLGASFAFRVTGLVNTGTPLYTVNVMARDN